MSRHAQHTAAILAAGVALCLLAAADRAQAGVDELSLGSKAPDFSLPATDGKTYTFADVAGPKGTLVIFTCNHCPYAVAYQDRIVALTEHYRPLGIGVAAISCNDAQAYPDDSFAKMKERAAEKKFNFPYLYDETQAIALKYGPKVTPHVFLFDSTRTLIYRGRIDDSAKEKGVKKRELADALDAILAGKPVPTPSTIAFGCSIKWKPDVLEPAKKP